MRTKLSKTKAAPLPKLDFSKHIYELVIKVYSQRTAFIKRNLTNINKAERDNYLPTFESIMEKAYNYIYRYKSVERASLDKISQDSWELYNVFLPIFNNHNYSSLNVDSVEKQNPLMIFYALICTLDKLRDLTLLGGTINMVCCNTEESQFIEFITNCSDFDKSKLNRIKEIFNKNKSAKSRDPLTIMLQKSELKTKYNVRNIKKYDQTEKELSLKIFF